MAQKEERMSGQREYFPAIDGLRAISVIIVFLFHCDLRFMDLGWCGVQFFFVISGFLITDILINQLKNTDSFVRFFTKRILRITPISVFVLLVCSVFFFIQNNHIPNNWVFYLFNVQKFLWVFNTSLIDLNGWLGHTWTLAIEEQFYLLWPFIIYWVPRNKIGLFCLLTIFVTFIYRIICSVFLHNTLAASVLLLSQTDSLALGGILAFLKNKDDGYNLKKLALHYSIIVGFLSLFLVILSLSFRYNVSIAEAYHLLRSPDKYLVDGFTSQLFFFVALISFGIIDLIIRWPKAIITKLLSMRVLVHIGLISYGLYIYHWPVLIIVKHFTQNALVVTIVAGIITYLIALTSYNTIEAYFRRHKTFIVTSTAVWVRKCKGHLSSLPFKKA